MQKQLDLQHWYSSQEGKVFAQTLQASLQPHLERTFGYFAVQSGYSPLDLLSSAAVTKHIVVGNYNGDIQCESEYLPLESNSIDLLVLSHTLELAADPHAALREAERVLVPEGRLYIIGLTPFSIAGAYQNIRNENYQRYTSLRIRDWLSVLGFDHLGTQSMKRVSIHKDYQQPIAKAGLKGANYLLSKCKGGGYIIQAKKRVTRLTPLRQHWRSKPAIVRPARVIKPSAQVARERWRMK